MYTAAACSCNLATHDQQIRTSIWASMLRLGHQPGLALPAAAVATAARICPFRKLTQTATASTDG